MRLRYLLSTLVALAGVWHRMPLRAGVVVGNSMAPTLHSGQFFVLDRAHYATHAIARGDIIAFKHNGEVYIKRVYAVPGDAVWELRSGDGDNILLRPDQIGWERGLLSRMPALGQMVRVPISSGEVYVLGDARENSIDSRELGPIPVSEILGKAFA